MSSKQPAISPKWRGIDFPLPDVKRPLPVELRASLRTSQKELRNHWPLWVMPISASNIFSNVRLHTSVSSETSRELFPEAEPLGDRSTSTDHVVVASRFDDQLVRLLEAGGRVLLLPDGQTNSFPLAAHWFLRGAPFVPGSSLLETVPRNLLVELQHFDLASEVIPNVDYLDVIDPLLMLWDTHDLQTIKLHGLVFETQAGRGRLLVSALNHRGQSNAAGRWLLGVLLDRLQAGPEPKHRLSDERWQFLKMQLHAETIPLVKRQWQFRPDPNNQGLALGWQRPQLDSAKDWAAIKIGAAWEGQGYPTLDHWAWYRLAVDIPSRWQGRPIYLSFEGVDDIYELYVNGELAGKGGDLATRQDAFNERKSHDITRWVVPGQPAVIAVRVYDWYGAGGIFRPVTLGTVPFRPGLELLK